ncbi:MAG: bacterial Ig-like domain-containing protein [Paludibacteraceae bacterium]|nr:bacterial Ig-like domain-containing protein [Paludibacteraceae bacterium]
MTFDPDGGNFAGSQTISLSQEDSKAIYYTTDATAGAGDPSDQSPWVAYDNDNKPSISATTTIYAAAKDGSAWSSVVSKTFTKVTPLTTMEEVQAQMPESGSATIHFTITDWVVTAAKEKQSQVWITNADNTKGILLYKSDHGFVAGNKLNGTVVDATIAKFNGGPELTSLTSSQVNVTNITEDITPIVTTLASLTSSFPADQGRIVTLENMTYSSSSSNFSDGTNTIALDTRLLASSPTLTNTKKYNLTGVVMYASGGTIKLIPRSTNDIQLVPEKTLSFITLDGTYPTTFEQGDEFSHAGMTVTAHYTDNSTDDVTSSASFTGYNMANTGNQTVTVSYTEGTTKTETYSITVNEPTPTGDWELFDGELTDLEEGDYLIYDDGYQGSLMIAEIASSRFNYEVATPDANGIISNPSGYAVWTLAKSGDYWTFYNVKAGKYAAATGASGKAQLMDDLTGEYADKAKWAIDDNLVVTNKYNTDNSVNAMLRHNFSVSDSKNYGFACYSNSTGNVPVFYKQATPSYYISETLTGCSAAEGNATKVPQTPTEDVILKYNLTPGYVWPDAITVEVGGVALDANELDYDWDITKTPAELTIDYTKVNGNIAITIEAQAKTLTDITIAQAPTKVDYETGETFDPAGLQISLNYTVGASDIVEYSNLTAADFTFSPDLETALEKTDVKVTITYAGENVDQTITVTDPVPQTKAVVLIAEYDNKFYAMSNAVANNVSPAIEITKNGDNIVVASTDEKNAVQWYMSKLGSTVNLQVTDENGQYLSSTSGSASMSLSDSKTDWTITQDGTNYLIAIGSTRAILYQANGNTFKHYATSNTTGYARITEIFEVAEGATNIEVVTPIVHEFAIDPDEAVDFGTVEVGESVSSKSFDVTLTNIASATVTLDDNTAFSIDVTALTADGTITVTPNTENAGNFSATITLSDDAGVAADKVINVTMKVVVPRDCDREDDFNTVGANSSYTTRNSTDGWNAVNTAVIAGEDITYWMISGGTDEVGVITSPEFNYGIGKLSFDYKYTFNESNGVSFKVEIKQDGALVAGKSYTVTNATAVQNTVYSETIENINVEGKFQIVITNLSPSNKTGHKDRFAIGNLCWKKYGEPAYDEVRTGLTTGWYYTMCLDKAVDAVQGGTIWRVLSKAENNKDIILEEVIDRPLVAGRPYIFNASADKLEVLYDGKKVNAPLTEGNNGLVGSFTEEVITPNPNYYILYNNALYYVEDAGATVKVGAHRAYLDMTGVPAYSNVIPAPGVRRVHMAVYGEQTATGCENINATDAPVKMIIDGQLYILRGEKMYNANGQLVK